MVEPAERVRVWDLPVRVFHWTLVAAFALAWVSAEETDALHYWAGYIALALIALRIVWGFAGSVHARFADFVPRPAALLAYVRQMLRGREPRFLGHNPAAAVMIVFLMAMVSFTAVTGWLAIDPAWGEALEDLHEGAAWITLAAIVLHVAGVIYESMRHRENLVRAMLSGYKRP